jgi:hypothetical protein
VWNYKHFKTPFKLLPNFETYIGTTPNLFNFLANYHLWTNQKYIQNPYPISWTTQLPNFINSNLNLFRAFRQTHCGQELAVWLAALVLVHDLQTVPLPLLDYPTVDAPSPLPWTPARRQRNFSLSLSGQPKILPFPSQCQHPLASPARVRSSRITAVRHPCSQSRHPRRRVRCWTAHAARPLFSFCLFARCQPVWVIRL